MDSGAIYSVVPTLILEKLGIKPLAEQEFRMDNGTKVLRKKGGALFKYGERIGVPMLFLVRKEIVRFWVLSHLKRWD